MYNLRRDAQLCVFITFNRSSCLDTVPKILANTRRTIVRLYRAQNTRGNTKIIESRFFFDHIINVKPQFCLTCVETHNCASFLRLIARLASIRCHKILANTRRTIVRLYRAQNTRGNTKIIESRNVFLTKQLMSNHNFV